jgi:hypothetical protein
LRPSIVMKSSNAGERISRRKRSCCSSSRARRVGPGWLHEHHQSSRRRGAVAERYSLEELDVVGFLEILQIGEIGHEFGLVKQLLGSEVIEIGRIRKALHKLGRMGQ